MKTGQVMLMVKTCMLMSFFFFYSCAGNKTKTGSETNEEVKKTHTKPTTNIKPNDKVSSPLEIKLNSQGLWQWHAFEGEVGIARIFDGAGNELGMGILSSSDGNWMKGGDPAFFGTTITFSKQPTTQTGKLIIYNNPGPGDGEEAGEEVSFEIPVIFKK